MSAAEGGVILMYHHVDDSTPAITSVTPDQFEQHLEYLDNNNFAVIDVVDMLDAISNHRDLPARAVAITFDDAYESVYTAAFPMLKQRNWPFAVFVATEPIDKGYEGFMSWDQLREMQSYGAEIGGHTVSHAHLIRKPEEQSEADWSRQALEEILKGNQRIEEEIGNQVKVFAYPYGELNSETKQILAERNIYGLAQQSGAAGVLTDMQAIPRYPMAHRYASMERFALVAQSKALPVVRVDAGDPIRIAGQRGGRMRLQLRDGDYQPNNLACYSASGETLEIRRDGNSVTISLPRFLPGRAKVNCTAPSASESDVYYWYSAQWLVKTAEDDWPAEY